jgi:hypothetical protein
VLGLGVEVGGEGVEGIEALVTDEPGNLVGLVGVWGDSDEVELGGDAIGAEDEDGLALPLPVGPGPGPPVQAG